jgi:predicted nucleotidyltransferase
MEQRLLLDRDKLTEIARRRNIAYLALFGSYARGQAEPGSDVDLYARFGRHVSLFEMLGIKHEMEDALGLPVDLIVEEVVIPYQFVREGMAKDMVVLYDDERAENAAAQ